MDMAVIVGKPSPSVDESEARAVAVGQLALQATSDGCALVDSGGQVVFYADGLGGRRECLRYARDHGVLALLS
jgi:hypothetical protein